MAMECNVAPASSGTAERDVRAAASGALSAIVFREILKPLAAGLGPVGDAAIGSVADALFARPKT
jgi:hypothetical protein